MKKFTEVTDENGHITAIKTSLTGSSLMAVNALNKGSAFTREERQQLGLFGRLPYYVETLEEQVARHYRQYKAKTTDLGRNVYLNQLKQNNAVLFYALTSRHLKEMLPIVYTPTIGDAVQNFSYEFNKPVGIYLSYPNKDCVAEILENRVYQELDLIIVSDGEGVLGIGDWGVGGMDICIGKLMVYTLCGGINPRRVLPICLDVGTNNEQLLNDPMYMGWRNKRISGKEYDDFIEAVVSAIRQQFPDIYLHWEDFGRENARKNLNRYREHMCTFNDDIQGTGATALAALLSGVKAAGQKLAEQRIVFFGAGTAGVGIADEICKAMVHAGLSIEAARDRFWLIDRAGLLVDGMPDVVDFQKPYVRSQADIANWTVDDPNHIGLLEVVKNLKPTVLVGCSTVTGAFNEEVVKCMAEHVEHPMIFPLSNPTSRSEANPADLMEWTDGKAFIAAGSPYQDVTFNGNKIRISQCNNAFVFPGLGLGIIAAKATRVTDGMIAAAAHALSEHSPAINDDNAPLLPDFDHIHQVSKDIALAVAKQARQEGVAGIPDDTDLKTKIDAIFWEPKYVPYYPE